MVKLEYHSLIEMSMNKQHYQQVLILKDFYSIFLNLLHVTNLVKHDNDDDIIYVQIFIHQDLINPK